MTRRLPETDDSPIVFYDFELTGTRSFRKLLERRFRETGHTRPIEFRAWDCYSEEPGRDGDLYAFDAVALSALVDKGYLHDLPTIRTGDIFGWVLDKSRVRKKVWAVPFMLCGSVVVCRRAEDEDIRSVMQIRDSAAVPLKSMFMYYCLQAFCNHQSDREKTLAVIRHLIGLTGEGDALNRSGRGDYDGIGRFSRGECRYFIGFTEDLRELPEGDYAVRFANFSLNERDEMPLFMTDCLAMGARVRGEKLLDCADLIELAAGEDLLFDFCAGDGRPLYFLPANKRAYPRLAALDPLYGDFLRRLDSEENGVFRYGPRFYEEFRSESEALMRALWGGSV